MPARVGVRAARELRGLRLGMVAAELAGSRTLLPVVQLPPGWPTVPATGWRARLTPPNARMFYMWNDDFVLPSSVWTL